MHYEYVCEFNQELSWNIKLMNRVYFNMAQV